MFILVRTDPDAPKHQASASCCCRWTSPGVTVRPIRMINGEAPFNATFFDNATATKDDLIGELNRGWTVGKRLLQHERSGMGELMMGGTGGIVEEGLVEEAKSFLGDSGGRIADPVWRYKVAVHQMNRHAYRLAQRRAVRRPKVARRVRFPQSSSSMAANCSSSSTT